MKVQSLSETHKDIFADWDHEANSHIDIRSVSKTSRILTWWVCPMGHRYQVSVTTRIRTNGCKICGAIARSGRFVRGTKKSQHTLAEINPEFLKEWHPNKNYPMTPEDIAAHSHRKVWWCCVQTHEWESSPHSRLGGPSRRGNNCPVCAHAGSGDRIRRSRLAKSGPLTEVFPHVLAEWDYEKNSESPSSFSPKSNKRVSWICKYGHRWEATITNRTHNESGCPFCTNQTSRLEIFLLCELRTIFQDVEWRKKINGDECDLFIPSINTAIEIDGNYWHINKLTKDIQKSQRLSEKGIEVIRIRQVGLPQIIGEVIEYKSDRDRLDVCLELCRNIELKHHNNSLLEYIKAERVSADADFKKMIARLPAPPIGYTLADKFPEVSGEWDFKANMPLTPDLFSSNSEQKVIWRCSQGHSFQATIKNRTARKSGCPACYSENRPEIMRKARANKTVTLADANPSFLAMWDEDKNDTLKPTEIAAKSGYQVWWRCGNRHSFRKNIYEMGKNSDCPLCNSLAFCFPAIAAEWSSEENKDQTPWTVSARNGFRAWWICKNGHKWQTAVSSRTRAQSGCKQCSGDQRREKYNTVIATTDFLAEWAYDLNTGITPEQITAMPTASVWWRCINGHIFKKSIYQRTSRGCGECAKTLRPEKARLGRLKHTGSLVDNSPQVALQWHKIKNGELTPENISEGSKRVVWWLCPIGHEWQQSCNDRTTLFKRNGRLYCPHCGRNAKGSS